MNTKFARFASKLTAATLLASTVLATGCAAPLDNDASKTSNLGTSQQGVVVLDDASEGSTENLGTSQPATMNIPQTIIDLMAIAFELPGIKGMVHMTATNASESPLGVAYCGKDFRGNTTCTGTVLAPGESFDQKYLFGGLKGVMLVPDNAGRCPQLNLDGQMRSWCPVSLASWNPLIGEPKIALSTDGKTATEFAFSENGYTDVRRGTGVMDFDLFAPKKATIVPFEAQLKRSADSSGNTKEMSITVTRVHPRQSFYNLVQAGWVTPCNDGNKCEMINL